jgi:hypothetical protein
MISADQNVVDAFAIEDSGTLTEVQGAPYAAGLGPQLAAISGDGSNLYVGNNGSQDISGYAIDAGSGALTPLAGSPFTTGANPLGIAIPRKPSNDFSPRRTKAYGRAQAKLILRVPGPGMVSVHGPGVRKRHRHFRSLKPEMLITAKGKARRQLLERGRVAVTVDVRYRPDGGRAFTTPVRVKLAVR